jgi:hypothetical protein
MRRSAPARRRRGPATIAANPRRIRKGAAAGFAQFFAGFGRVLCLHPEKLEERARKGTYTRSISAAGLADPPKR